MVLFSLPSLWSSTPAAVVKEERPAKKATRRDDESEIEEIPPAMFYPAPRRRTALLPLAVDANIPVARDVEEPPIRRPTTPGRVKRARFDLAARPRLHEMPPAAPTAEEADDETKYTSRLRVTTHISFGDYALISFS